MIVPATAPEPSGDRAAGKSPGAFRTIAEVAADLQLPAHVLRFWESKFTQIKPLKRRGGRRYYRPEDVVLLRRIRSLLYTEGYTIKGVQRLLREGGGRVPPAVEPAPGRREERAKELTSPAEPASHEPGGEVLREVREELMTLRALLRRHGY